MSPNALQFRMLCLAMPTVIHSTQHTNACAHQPLRSDGLDEHAHAAHLVVALAEACAKGAMPRIKHLDLDHNNVGDEGCAALVKAIDGGALPAIKTVCVGGNPASAEARDAVVDAIIRQRLAAQQQ